jgi:hypothetical protein
MLGGLVGRKANGSIGLCGLMVDAQLESTFESV